MCLFDALERLDAIRLSGTREDGWHIENARLAMREGRILYAGKYSEPDYEMLLDHDCPLAIESLMIGRASEVKDKLEELGIVVFIDQSSICLLYTSTLNMKFAELLPLRSSSIF